MQLISDVLRFQADLAGLNYKADSSEFLDILKTREKTQRKLDLEKKNLPHVGEFYFNVTSI